jgi:hypothetical protein
MVMGPRRPPRRRSEQSATTVALAPVDGSHLGPITAILAERVAAGTGSPGGPAETFVRRNYAVTDLLHSAVEVILVLAVASAGELDCEPDCDCDPTAAPVRRAHLAQEAVRDLRTLAASFAKWPDTETRRPGAPRARLCEEIASEFADGAPGATITISVVDLDVALDVASSALAFSAAIAGTDTAAQVALLQDSAANAFCLPRT